MRIIATILIIFFIFRINTANAQLKDTSPTKVCVYMKDFGLTTLGWNHVYGNTFFCGTSLKELGASSSPTENPNNHAYYVDGDSTVVDQVKLVLNVNDRGTAKAAHEEFLNEAEALCMKATGEKLPKELKKAIKAGKKAVAKVGSASVQVVREDWPTGKGYDVQVLIK
jgi:hypothetical protein